MLYDISAHYRLEILLIGNWWVQHMTV